MAVRPILFSGPMVRAILAERKTMTRRALKPTGPFLGVVERPAGIRYWFGAAPGENTSTEVRARWTAGDLLWVREAWRCNGWATDLATIFYRASEGDGYTAMCEQYLVDEKRPLRVTASWRPGIHLPRWASRITLAVSDVRVERLQEISNRDARAEGIIEEWGPSSAVLTHCATSQTRALLKGIYRATAEGKPHDLPREAYADLWEQINGLGSWAANPWVSVVSFKPILANIDAVLADPAAYGIAASKAA